MINCITSRRPPLKQTIGTPPPLPPKSESHTQHYHTDSLLLLLFLLLLLLSLLLFVHTQQACVGIESFVVCLFVVSRAV